MLSSNPLNFTWRTFGSQRGSFSTDFHVHLGGGIFQGLLRPTGCFRLRHLVATKAVSSLTSFGCRRQLQIAWKKLARQFLLQTLERASLGNVSWDGQLPDNDNTECDQPPSQELDWERSW